MTKPFKGVIKLDVRDSKSDWTPCELPRAPKGAPNVLIILNDDAGLAAWSPFGGRVNMPTLQKLADNGLTYTQWHTHGALLADAFDLPHRMQSQRERADGGHLGRRQQIGVAPPEMTDEQFQAVLDVARDGTLPILFSGIELHLGPGHYRRRRHHFLTAAPAPRPLGHLDVGTLTRDDTAVATATIRAVNRRLLPFLFLLYIFNFLDRSNVGLAALQMNRDLGFSAAAFGLGAGIFFVGYSLFEVPSNLLLVRVGARRWIARIMISWGIIAVSMMFVRTTTQFYVLRFLLGVAEAGFFPAIMYYLSEWYPASMRATSGARFMIAIPLSGVLGGPLGGWLLGLRFAGLAGWQWLFLVEGLPSIVLGFVVLRYLTERPAEATWLAARPTRLARRATRARSVGFAGAARPPATQRTRPPHDLGRGASGAARHDRGVRVPVLGSDTRARCASPQQLCHRAARRRSRGARGDREC